MGGIYGQSDKTNDRLKGRLLKAIYITIGNNTTWPGTNEYPLDVTNVFQHGPLKKTNKRSTYKATLSML